MLNQSAPPKTNTPPKNCRSVTSLLLDYLSEELQPEIAVAFEAHLGQCRDCLSFLNTYKKTIEMTRAFLSEPSIFQASSPKSGYSQEKTGKEPR